MSLLGRIGLTFCIRTQLMCYELRLNNVHNSVQHVFLSDTRLPDIKLKLSCGWKEKALWPLALPATDELRVHVLCIGSACCNFDGEWQTYLFGEGRRA